MNVKSALSIPILFIIAWDIPPNNANIIAESSNLIWYIQTVLFLGYLEFK